MQRWLLAVVATSALIALTARADAMCAPAFQSSAADGGIVPTTGVLYVYSNAGHVVGPPPHRHIEPIPIAVHWVGAVGTVQQRAVAPNVFQMSYRGDAGSELVVGVGFESAHYRLSDAWHAPVAPPAVDSFEHSEKAGGCPSWDVVDFHLDQTSAAIRVRWTIGDVTTEWVVPTANEHLSVGTKSCGMSTVPVRQLGEGGRLELVAIRLDGSEVAVRGVPRVLSVDSMAADGWRDALDAAARAAEPRDVPGDGVARPLVAIALFIVGLALSQVWFRRAIERLR